jgi:hypothetical protein
MQSLRLFRNTAANIVNFSLIGVPVLSPAVPGHPPVVPHIGVIVHNASNAPAYVVRDAGAACQEILGRAGIEIRWISAAGDASWEGPSVIFRAAIVQRAPRVKGTEVFGTELPNKVEGIQLIIYYDRVSTLSRLSELPSATVLSGAFAHEIGHLLLQSSEHSVAGIMRGEWGKRELNELGQGLLRFTSQQKRQMQSYMDELAATRSGDREGQSRKR